MNLGPACRRGWRAALTAALGVIMLGTTLHAGVRRPAVAGAFYPGEGAALAEQVRSCLRGSPEPGGRLAALIVPHAGYVFSGPTAGRAFSALRGADVERVILLGPSHHASFAGAALPSAETTAFATPLGELELDREALARIAELPDFDGPARAHDREHCLEVELPFLQETLRAPRIVPILIGNRTDRAQAARLARALTPLLTPRTVVVVSSDFTHHGAPYGWRPFALDSHLGARLIDQTRATAGRAAAIDPRGFWEQVEVSDDTVCGARPIGVLLELLAHAFEGTGTMQAVTTSADVSGDLSQVVAYASVSFAGAWTRWTDERPAAFARLTPPEQDRVLALARATLETHLGHGCALAGWFATGAPSDSLRARSGVFVTIHNRGPKAVHEGRLRGCIGMIEAQEPLVDAIIHSAVSAAHDPRFPALTVGELPNVSLEVSVLSPLTDVAGPDDIEMGTHGVLLEKQGRRAVFLPQVASETGWDRATFLTQLSLKAGLPRDAWRSGARFQVFTAQVFGEKE